MSWAGAIAISYPARAAGVRRFDSADVVRRKCPEARLQFIETIEEGATAHTSRADPVKKQTDQRFTKLCLLRYRRASSEVFDAIEQWITRNGMQNVPIERASIDECFVDVTEPARAFAATDCTSSPDTDLRAGAQICAELRAHVLRETSFTISGGIARSKVVAKLASSRNKPDGQTTLALAEGCEALLALPVRAVPGCRGILGTAVESFIRNYGDFSNDNTAAGGTSLRSLRSLLVCTDEPCRRVHEACSALKKYLQQPPCSMSEVVALRQVERLVALSNGNDTSEVKHSNAPKSLACSRSFCGLHKLDEIVRWMRLLVDELCGDRLPDDAARWKRLPVNLVLSMRVLSVPVGLESSSAAGNVGSKGPSATRTRSVSSHLSDLSGQWPSNALPQADGLLNVALSLLNRLRSTHEVIPCTRITLGVSKFAKLPCSDPAGSSEGSGVAQYFSRGAVSAKQPITLPSKCSSGANASSSMIASAQVCAGQAWSCMYCTFQHSLPHQAAFLCCAMCGTNRPKVAAQKKRRRQLKLPFSQICARKRPRHANSSAN